MESLLEILKSDNFILISFVINVVLVIAFIMNSIMLSKTKKEYLAFMRKLGNGNNIDEMLKTYIEDVKEIKKDNSEIKAYYIKLDSDIGSCIQKTGLVRYNAFQNVGSDLSFAIALLDRENNGVVLNGLYGSDSSNIYAKPIKNGESTKYQLSDEEKYAIEIAEQSKSFYAKHRK